MAASSGLAKNPRLTTTRPYAFDQRMNDRVDAKRQIAKAAKRLVHSGQTIMIDGGTTTFYLAEELLGQALQIVTNSLPIADLFINEESVELLVTGGHHVPPLRRAAGPDRRERLSTIHTQTLFISVAGVHEGVLYNQNLLLVQSEQRMMQQSQQVVVLADSGKFGQQALMRLCGLDEVDVVVSDAALSEVHQEQIRDAGCELILAPSEDQRRSAAHRRWRVPAESLSRIPHRLQLAKRSAGGGFRVFIISTNASNR